MKSKELILGILDYCKVQGVDFETACRMLTMMHEDGIHLEDDCCEGVSDDE